MLNTNLQDVLIIDDDKDICAIIKKYLEDIGGFRLIVEAHDGAVATLKLQNQKFCLIILDMTLPKRNGFDLIKEFEGNSVNKKDSVLVISGTLDRDLISRIIQRGVKNFLVKPFDEQSFREKVAKMVP
jgi:response regulator of citrate/malate metabolism